MRLPEEQVNQVKTDSHIFPKYSDMLFPCQNYCKLQYCKTCVKRPLSKRQKIVFQDQLSLNAGQKYCRMLQKEHSAILMTFIKIPFVIKILVLSIFEWLLLVAMYQRIGKTQGPRRPTIAIVKLHIGIAGQGTTRECHTVCDVT